jgi:penicillin-binding protein 1A
MKGIEDLLPPAAEGEDQGAGKEQDYNNYEYIGPESKPVRDDNIPAKKDTLNKSPLKKEEGDKPIGSQTDEAKKKKGLLQRLFGKKEKL